MEGFLNLINMAILGVGKLPLHYWSLPPQVQDFEEFFTFIFHQGVLKYLAKNLGGGNDGTCEKTNISQILLLSFFSPKKQLRFVHLNRW